MRPPVIWATARLDAAAETLEALVRAGVEVHVVAGDRPAGEAVVELGGRGVPVEGADWAPTPLRAARVPVLSRVEQLLHVVAGRTRAEVERSERSTAIAGVVHRRARELGVEVVVAVGAEVARPLRRVGRLLVVDVDAEGPDGRRSTRGASVLAAIECNIGGRRAGRVLARAELVVPPGESADLLAALPASAIGPRDSAPVHGPRPASASIVVATRDRPALLHRSVPSVLAAADREPGTEVIVVQQGAGQELAKAPGLVVVHDEGRGASRARNLGVAQARGEVVLFTDDDCMVPVGWVTDHLDALRDPAVVLTCGQVTGLSRAPASADPVASPLRHRAVALPWHLGHGSNLAVRRSALLAAGGWDERLGPGTALPAGEDADLIARVMERGGHARSGVGAAVSHIDWRSDDDDAANLAAYEQGAGVWIGKALRARRPMSRAYLRGRLRLLRTTGAPGARRAFAVGVVRGLRLRSDQAVDTRL